MEKEFSFSNSSDVSEGAHYKKIKEGKKMLNKKEMAAIMVIIIIEAVVMCLVGF